jgi:hypothetical protein
MLVEAKLTEDRDYVVESIYKVFGYLHDYADGLTGSRYPQAALVVWGGVQDPPFDAAQQLQLVDASGVRAGRLATLVSDLAEAVN